MVTEARCVVHDVADGDRHDAREALPSSSKPISAGTSRPAFASWKRSRGERCAPWRWVDVECRVVDGRDAVDAGERAQALEIRVRRKSDGDGAAQVGATTLRHAHARR